MKKTSKAGRLNPELLEREMKWRKWFPKEMTIRPDGMSEAEIAQAVEAFRAFAEDVLILKVPGRRIPFRLRDAQLETVADIIGANITEEVHNHHNFAWKETHNGEEYVVVRKGATPAFPGQKGFVGSNMEDVSVIIEGVDSEESKEGFYSTMHGAGRVMSRTQAAGKSRRKNIYACGSRDCEGFMPYRDLKQDERKPVCPDCGSNTNKMKRTIEISKGEVDFEEVKKRVTGKNIVLRGAGADESKEVYKDLQDVIKDHEGTIKVLETLQPVIVCMAGANEFDPYKD
jgi:tRNA-splicing ligase RtcB